MKLTALRLNIIEKKDHNETDLDYEEIIEEYQQLYRKSDYEIGCKVYRYIMNSDKDIDTVILQNGTEIRLINSFSCFCLTMKITNAIKKDRGINLVKIPKRFKKE